MQFTITPEFTSKVFEKVGSMAGSDLDLTREDNQIKFCQGFVESLQKEAGMAPEMALGFIGFVAEKGAEWMVAEGAITEDQLKTAGIGSALVGIKDKVLEGTGDFFAPLWEGKMRDAISDTADRYVGQAKDMFKNIGGDKAWGYLKSPDFLQGVAPYLVGGLGGMLLPKLFNREAGPVSMGAGALGGAMLGKYLSDNTGKLTSAFQNGMDAMRKANSDWVKGTRTGGK